MEYPLIKKKYDFDTFVTIQEIIITRKSVFTFPSQSVFISFYMNTVAISLLCHYSTT